MASQSLLVPVDPTLVNRVARYLWEPRQRETIALELATGAPVSTRAPAWVAERTAGIAARLDAVVRLRARALESHAEADAAEYGRRVWNELAWLAATSAAAFVQAPGLSLGRLAHPERFARSELPKHVRHLNRAIRYLLKSTSVVAPELGVPAWEHALPAWGGGGLASGCVPAEFADWLSLLLHGKRFPLEPLAREVFGEHGLAVWRDSALAAAQAAHARHALLLEVDARVLRAQCFSPRVHAQAVA